MTCTFYCLCSPSSGYPEKDQDLCLLSPKKLSKHCLRNSMWKIGSARSFLIPEEHCDFRSINQSAYVMESLWSQHNWVGVPTYAQLTPHWEIRNRSALPPLSSLLLYQQLPAQGTNKMFCTEIWVVLNSDLGIHVYWHCFSSSPSSRYWCIFLGRLHCRAGSVLMLCQALHLKGTGCSASDPGKEVLLRGFFLYTLFS